MSDSQQRVRAEAGSIQTDADSDDEDADDQQSPPGENGGYSPI